MPHHDRNDETLTIADLSRSLNLPESTTRYYCKRFAAHLTAIGDGRRRRYTPRALDTLQTIAEAMRRNKSAFAVDLALRGTSPPPAPAPGPALAPELAVDAAAPAALSGQILSLMERQTEALQQIAGAMAVFAEKIALPSVPPAQALPPAAVAPPAAPGEEETAALRDEVATLRRQVRTAESVHQNDLEQMRKWLSRLGEALSRR